MDTLSSQQLKDKIVSYLNGDITPGDMSKWAVNTHWRYEKRELDFIGCERKKMLEIIFILIDFNDKRFAPTKDELRNILEEL